MEAQPAERRILVCFDIRCVRDDAGIVYTYESPAFFERYAPAWNDVRIFTRMSRCPAPPRGMQPVLHPRIHFADVPSYDGLRGYFAARRHLQRCAERELETADDVIIRGWNTLGHVVWKQVRRLRRPYAMEVTGDPSDLLAPGVVRHPLRPLLRKLAVRQLAQQCRHACAASYVTHHTLQQRFPCPHYSDGISNADLTDAAFVSEPRRFVQPLGTAAHPGKLVGVGSMSQRYKGFDVLLHAVADGIRRGMRLELALVGDGRYRAELEAQSRLLGLERQVEFFGQLPAGSHVRTVLDRCDVFVLPSRTEGLPRAMLEAMARGMPAIGSTAGGIPELLPPDELVPPSNAAALSQALRELLSDPERLTLASRRNWQRARDYHRSGLDQRRLNFYRHVQACGSQLPSFATTARRRVRYRLVALDAQPAGDVQPAGVNSTRRT